MDKGVFLCLPTIKGISLSTTHYVQTWGGWGFIRLHCCSLTCNKSGTGARWEWGIETSLLCKQIITWGKGLLFTTREGHLGSSACYIKTPTLLPSLYCCGSNPTPSPITTSESWLYREGYKMDNDPRSLRYKIYTSHLYKGSGPCWLNGWVFWAIVLRKRWKAEYGWEISWDGLLAEASTL